MSSHTLTISYSLQADTREALDLLLIEQQDWKPYTGVVTKAAMVGYVSAMLYGTAYQHQMDCGLIGGNVVCAVNVYPRTPNLAYRFAASWGELSERAISIDEIEESINFTLTDTVTPKYPPVKIISATWMDTCYSAAGAIINPPSLTIANGEIKSAAICYGAVTVRYTTERHAYLLTCPRRDDAMDNHYSACVYGVYYGGINWLELEMPPNIEAFEANPDADCGWGTAQGSITGPADNQPPVEDHSHDRATIVDYCTQAIIADEVS